MRKALNGVAWLIGGRLGYMVLSLVATGFLARLLSPADFGVLAVVLLVVGLPTALFDGAFAIGIIQKKAIDDQFTSDCFWASLWLSVLFFLPIVLAAGAIERFFDFPDLASLVRITASVIFFKAAANVPTALLQRHGKHKHIAALGVVAYLVGYCFVGVGLALMGQGAIALVAAVTVTAALEFVLSFALAPLRLKAPPNRARVMAVFSSSSMLTLAQLFNWGANTGANMVVGRLLGATELGLYSRGWKLLEMATAATAEPLRKVLLPAFSRLQDDLPAARRAFCESLRIALVLFAVLSGMLAANAESIIRIALGSQWGDAVPIVALLFAALVPRCTFKVTESLATGLGQTRTVAVKQLLYATLMIGAALIGAHWGGSLGVASAVVVAVWCFYLVSLLHAKHLLGLSFGPLLAMHATAAVFGLGMYGVCMGLSLKFFKQSSLVDALAHLVTSGLLTALVAMVLPASVVGERFHHIKSTALRRLRSCLSMG